MASPQQLAALKKTYDQAKVSGHLFPDFAACEVMVESRWGTTELFLRANNGFGEKQHQVPVFETVSLPTWEVIHGQTVHIQADFIKFPTLSDCFDSRMATLRRLAPEYPNYQKALEATTGEDFVHWVSKTWSTDPNRADTVISIRHSHPEVFA